VPLQGERILMTGMTGQVGASLALGLAPLNEIWGLARYSKPGSREAVEAMGIHPVVADYTTGDLSGVPDDCTYVIHVAADTDPETIEIGLEQNAFGPGRLFDHCRRAKAWFYTSTTGVYWDHPDPYYRYKETDRVGGSTRVTTRFHYGTSKLAGEVVTRSLSQLHGVPAVLARLNVSYGRGGNGGLPGVLIDNLLAGQPITVNADWPMVCGPIHEDDLVEHVGPLLDSAVVGGNIVNWAGDEAVALEEFAPYIADLLGVPCRFEPTTVTRAYPRATDNTKRVSITGPNRVHWRDGFARVIADRHPELSIGARG